MTHEMERQDDKNLESVIATIQSMHVPEPPSNNEFLARILRQSAANRAAIGSQSVIGNAFRWKRNFRITAVALLVLMAVVGWLVLGSSGSVAIAQVIDSATSHRLVKCKIHKVGEFKDEFKDIYIGNVNNWYVMYTDLKSPRMRLEQPIWKTLNDVAEQSHYEILDIGADRHLHVNRFDLILAESDTNDDMQKKVIRSILDKDEAHKRHARLYRVPRQNEGNRFWEMKPYSDIGKDHSFLDTLRTMQNRKEITSSRDQVNGRDTVIYRLEDDDWMSTVWIDQRTRLPVQIEHLLIGEATGKQLASIKWTYTDFEWDPNVDDVETLFDTKPPAGYRFVDHSEDKNK